MKIKTSIEYNYTKVQKIEISAKTIIFTVFFLLGLQFLWTVRDILYGLFLAFIFMSALKPPVEFMARYKIPKAVGALLVIVVTIGVLLFSLLFVLPPLVNEMIGFVTTFPKLLSTIVPGFNQTINLNSLVSLLPNITDNFFKIVSYIFSNIVFFISVIFFTFYFLIEESIIATFAFRFFKDKKAELVVSVAHQIEQRMSSWVWGQAILMLIIGTLTYIGLSLMGVKYALSLAFIAGIFEVVPMIGPILSSVPAILVGLSISLPFAGIVAVLYFIIQQLENTLIVPFIMKQKVGIHPVVTLIALAIGGRLGGILGVFVSVPVAIIIETIILQLTSSKQTS